MQSDFLEELHSFFEKQLERTNYWLSFAEAKNAALIALNVAMIAFLAELKTESSVFRAILLVLLAVSCIISMVSFWPNTNSRIRKKETNVPHDNLVFWGDIAALKGEKQYIDLVVERYFPGMAFDEEHDKLSYDLVSEIITNSKIAKRKYLLFKIALFLDISRGGSQLQRAHDGAG